VRKAKPKLSRFAGLWLRRKGKTIILELQALFVRKVLCVIFSLPGEKAGGLAVKPSTLQPRCQQVAALYCPLPLWSRNHNQNQH
jgi:hypothetical protein